MNLTAISKYRSEIMGIATLWVMLFHFRANMHIAPFDYLSSIGYGGVDIFLFLSGFGLYCGFSKCKSNKEFYLRRFIRVYPLYLFVIIIHSVLLHKFNPLNMLMKSIGLGYFIPLVSNASYEWYVPTIMLFYLFFPLIYKLLNVNMLKWGGYLTGLGLILTGILILIHKGTIILTTSRIPIFVIGSVFGYCYINGISLKRLPLLCVLALITLCTEIFLVNRFDNEFLWRNAIYWLPFMIIVPGLCLMLCYIFEKVKVPKSNFLKWVGSISLESYLVHVICLGYYRDWCRNFIGESTIKLWVSFIIFLSIVLAISFILHKGYVSLLYGRAITKH